jgi:hypothetical protein
VEKTKFLIVIELEIVIIDVTSRFYSDFREVLFVGRPKQYPDKAAKARAYRLRKKLLQQAEVPDVEALARAVHTIYKKRANYYGGAYTQMIGKTPFETLVRVVLADVLYYNNVSKDGALAFPGWAKIIKPIGVLDEENPDFIVSGRKRPGRVIIMLPTEMEGYADDLNEVALADDSEN